MCIYMNKNDYKSKGSQPFVYEGMGGKVEMSYWLVPEDVLENREELIIWIRKSVEAKKRK